jgi:hypothetical protein
MQGEFPPFIALLFIFFSLQITPSPLIPLPFGLEGKERVHSFFAFGEIATLRSPSYAKASTGKTRKTNYKRQN